MVTKRHNTPSQVTLSGTALTVREGASTLLRVNGSERDKHYWVFWTSGGKGTFEDQGGTALEQVHHEESQLDYVVTAGSGEELSVVWRATDVAAQSVVVRAIILEHDEGPDNTAASVLDEDGEQFEATLPVNVIEEASTVTVALRPAYRDAAPGQALQTLIRQSTTSIGYGSYRRFMDRILCADDDDLSVAQRSARHEVRRRLKLPFPDTDAYRQLKVATEVFLMVNAGVDLGGPWTEGISGAELAAEARRYGRQISGPGEIEEAWKELLAEGLGRSVDDVNTILYLSLVRNKLQGVSNPVVLNGDSDPSTHRAAVECQNILMTKLTNPCFLELIWNYWHEEGLLVQTINTISWRFQNRRGSGDRDPLALLEIDPLRPLNNFIWGWVQDEQHRLTLVRRAYEYDHHYGITLLGKAVPPVRGADSRTRFVEAFHNLLYLCSIFFKEEDDTTVIADGFTVLNALKEVHLLLTQGAHNQYGDLPWTARQEMLMEQWLLARPEFREFLPRRIMVDYPEEWMDSVETMKTLQGWKTASVMHFRDLGVFGEQILLGIRFGAWPSVIEPLEAAAWARYWRPEIQGYIHAYRAATGVDLTEQPEATMPALLLQQRMAAQLPASVRARLPMQSNGNGRSAVPGRRR